MIPVPDVGFSLVFVLVGIDQSAFRSF